MNNKNKSNNVKRNKTTTKTSPAAALSAQAYSWAFHKALEAVKTMGKTKKKIAK